MRRWIACAALVSMVACSASMPTLRSTSWVRNDEFARTCTTSMARPEADGFGAAVGGLAFIVGSILFVAMTSDNRESPGKGPAAALGVTLAVPGGMSMLIYSLSRRHGLRSVRQCEEERAKCPVGAPRCWERPGATP